MNVAIQIGQFAKMLRNLDSWLEEAGAYAKSRGFEPEVLVSARLSPDQFSLVKQVQSACDAAKFAAAYLAGQKAPSHPDTELTLGELRERIRVCTAYLESIPASEYDGAGERRVSPPWLGGAWLTAEDYLVQASVPNFFFHVVTAYSILRHNGVPLGKIRYIGNLPVHTE